MSQHPSGILADALQLPADERLALAAELINSVEGPDDSEWEAAWLAELDRRAHSLAQNPKGSDDWASVRDRLLRQLRSR